MLLLKAALLMVAAGMLTGCIWKVGALLSEFVAVTALSVLLVVHGAGLLMIPVYVVSGCMILSLGYVTGIFLRATLEWLLLDRASRLK
jgi:hypothetical protein